ncbi:MarR family winged helix-turn-helix transcriptional regulator [Leptospira kmetyi]|uniref:MarR family winged helix-turn-helix transcriptional regulator n=1 Tax=Leptospira kmetyi TaxID=408139 RepID=UPI0005950400|nr:MarR family transcriptional regulator [Leptospira kmetyi]TGK16936.1 MarR family transcriptional regulator [Leptospira kmetyi]TGK32973.1 MarR family transcriptional regulator [Leptospira kmetyi]
MSEFRIENTLGYRVNRCGIAMRQDLRRRFNEQGHSITPEEWIILNRLWENDGLTQNEISQKTIKDKTTVTRFLSKMEEDGLIQRKSSKEDKRVNHVHLTAKGKKLKELLIPIAKELMSNAAEGISHEHLRITLETLKQIETNLSNLDSLQD